MDCKTAQKMIHLYTERKLDHEQLEEFLEHVENCQECSEELEVYFTIYYALRQLDMEEEDFYDMRSLLEMDLKRAHEHLERRDTDQFMKRFCVAVAIVTLLLLGAISVDSGIHGGFYKSKFYHMISTEAITLENGGSTEKVLIESAEAETNHKKEQIIKIPETEEYTEPIRLPDA